MNARQLIRNTIAHYQGSDWAEMQHIYKGDGYDYTAGRWAFGWWSQYLNDRPYFLGVNLANARQAVYLQSAQAKG
jgi:hypothetical protein